MMDLGLRNRRALITGGSRGIGRAIAGLMAREGAKVAVTYCNDRVRAESVARDLRDLGAEDTISSRLDLESEDSICETVQTITERWGSIDILVGNAVKWGPRITGSGATSQDVSMREWQKLIRANIEGSYNVMKEVLPGMKRSAWGRIVLVSSSFAVDGAPASLDWYAAAKSALHGLIRSQHRDLARAGILINAVMPGLTLTEHVLRNFPPLLRAASEQRSPLGRLLRPEEVASVVAFLCSNLNTGIVGEIVRTGGSGS